MGTRRTLEERRVDVIDYKRRHQLYNTWKELDNFLWDSYVGGEQYAAEKYLDKYPREIPIVYQRRQERAYYLNYVASVVDTYISEVFRRDPVRELPTNLNSFVEEATLEGEDLTAVSRAVLTRAVATDRAFVIVDKTNGEASRPYVHELHPENLLDFSVADDGSFNWALVAEMICEDSNPFEKRVHEMHYRLWFPEAWILFDKEGAPIDEGEAPGVVPIVSVAPGAMPLQMFDICRVNRRIYNICSQLDEIFINVTFPMFYYQPGPLPPELASVGEKLTPKSASPIELGVARALELPDGTTIPPGFLEPPGGAATMQIDERERLISSMYSMAGLKRRDPDSQIVESGVAKAYDFKEMNARLSSLSQGAEALEEDILFMVGAWSGNAEAEFNITYRKDFDVRDFAEMLEQHLMITDAVLPPGAKRRSAIDVSARIVEDAPPEERTAVIEEAEAMADEEFMAAESPLDAALANELQGGIPVTTQPIDEEELDAS